MILKNDIIDVLKKIKYPGYSRDIISFGIVKDIQINNKDLVLVLSVKSNNKKLIDKLSIDIKKHIQSSLNIDKLKIQIDLDKVTSNFEDNKIDQIKNIIAVGSAKGGVGKSTIAINLATELSKNNKVGFLDLDIYGPSLPLIIGEKETPKIINQKLVPIKKHGMQLMSFGFLNQGDSPAIWRGPMVAKLTNQFFDNVSWEDLDILVIDLPPGTGDIQLTLAQKLSLDGIIMVTTPQKISLADVRKGSEMFKKVNIPILGIVENMANFFLEGKISFKNENKSLINGKIAFKGTNNLVDIDNNGKFKIGFNFFDGPGGLSESKRLNVPLLGSIPLNSDLSLSIENGEPFMLHYKDSIVFEEFLKIVLALKNKFNLK